jgi:hypothetical protein
MPDAMKVAIDAEIAMRQLGQVGNRANLWINQASLETAQRVADEMRRRIARSQLPHKGDDVPTWTKIHYEKAKAGMGHVVMAYDATGKGTGGRGTQYHVDIWLERGTSRGMEAQPFLWVSAQLEEAAHLRRMQDAFWTGLNEVSG